MKVESKVLEIPVDNNFNAAVQQIANEGWTILPGAKAIFPISRTVNDDGAPVPAQTAPTPLAQQMPEVNAVLGDQEVYILRDGKTLDANYNEVTPEDRRRRWEAAEAARREHAIKQLRDEGVPEDRMEEELEKIRRDVERAA